VTSSTKAPYHHGNLREALIEAGLELAREGGPDAIVVREASRRVGVSHNAAYRHFPDRESLLEAVGERARGQLAAMMQQLIDQTDPGDDSLQAARARLRATGRAYVEFAIAEPGLFRTGFRTAPAEETEHLALGASKAPGPFSLLGGVLDGLDRAGGIAPGARSYAEFAAWSGVHGFSTLVLDGPLGAMPASEREAALERLFETIERGLAEG
jgi:AcrR family transcriptional regulator